MDAQRAIRTIRSRAREWNVNPGAVGIIGFSAGGEVAFLAATRYNSPVPGTADTIDALDCRPDFQALFYPMLPRVQPALTADTPIAFLCGVSHDGLTPGMVNLYTSLTAAGVSSEIHIYSNGSHGFGIRDEDLPVYSWTGLFLTWLKSGGFLSGSPLRKP
jgi:endo-1,4-beta-xylanase